VKTTAIFQIHFWFTLYSFSQNIKRNKLFQSQGSPITWCDISVIELDKLYSFICQGTSTKRQQSDLFGLESSYHLLLPV